MGEMRIALVARGIYPFDSGGRELRVYQMATHLSEKGHEVTVFVPEKGEISYPEEHGGFVINDVKTPFQKPFFVHTLGAWFFARKVSKMVPKEGFDVVDVLFYSFPVDSPKMVATEKVNFGQIKSLGPFRGLSHLPIVFSNYLLSLLKHWRSEAIICVSEKARDEVERYFPTGNKLIEIVKNGIDSETFKPIEAGQAKKKIGLDEDKFVAMYGGRLVKDKGVQDLIDAASELDRVELLIVGDGKMRESLEQRAQDLEVDATFVGQVPHREMPTYYSAADVFVLPSYWEIQPLSCIEAMACGTPVVATEIGGVPEIVKDGINGLLVPPNSHREISDSIKRLKNNPKLRKKLLQNGLAFASERTWERIVNQTLNIYKKAIDR